MEMNYQHSIAPPSAENNPDWEEIFEEQATPLREVYPEQLALYKHYFLTYWRKSSFFVKRGYDRPFAQPKSKKTGKPLPLFGRLADDALEQHLDGQRYADHAWVHDRAKFDKYIKRDDNLYWLGLYGG